MALVVEFSVQLLAIDCLLAMGSINLIKGDGKRLMTKTH